MASRVGNILKLIGRRPNAGTVIYHAADGVEGGGFYGKEKRHRVRKALARHRLRPSGMTDDILGSKESGGALDNKHEYEA